jgi:hypothetical protein
MLHGHAQTRDRRRYRCSTRSVPADFRLLIADLLVSKVGGWIQTAPPILSCLGMAPSSGGILLHFSFQTP